MYALESPSRSQACTAASQIIHAQDDAEPWKLAGEVAPPSGAWSMLISIASIPYETVFGNRLNHRVSFVCDAMPPIRRKVLKSVEISHIATLEELTFRSVIDASPAEVSACSITPKRSASLDIWLTLCPLLKVHRSIMTLFPFFFDFPAYR